jgi:hypothetical protein
MDTLHTARRQRPVTCWCHRSRSLTRARCLWQTHRIRLYDCGYSGMSNISQHVYKPVCSRQNFHVGHSDGREKPVMCCEGVIFAGPVVLSLVMPLLLSCPTWGVSASVCVDAVVSGDAFRAHFPVADVSVYCGCAVGCDRMIVAGDAAGARCPNARARARTCCHTHGGECPCALRGCVVSGC